MKKTIFTLLALLCLAPFTIRAQQLQPFTYGDRAVFLGNSITDGGRYHSYIWLWYMTRFPYMEMRVMNAGIGGDTAADMLRRLDGDVLSKRPSVLTVTFGMNDTGYFEYNGDDAEAFGQRKYEECYENFLKLEERLKGLQDVRVVMMGGSPYDETALLEDNTALRGKNAVMQRVVEFQRAAAEANGWEFVDLNEPMTALNRRIQQDDPSFALCGGDRVHPDNDGHMVMAYLYLKAQGMDGHQVAGIGIDASKKAVTETTNCEITNLKVDSRSVAFDYLAGSLPYPLDQIPHGWGSKRSQAQAAEIIPFFDEMNSERLKVTGLKDGMYRLTIDGEEIGSFSSSQLGTGGINLAEMTNTPQYRQALAIMHLNEQRWEIERNFRDYAWVQFYFFQPRGLLFANNDKSLEVLEKEREHNGWLNVHRENYMRLMHDDVREAREEQMELLIKKIYDINKPVVRKVVLTRAD